MKLFLFLAFSCKFVTGQLSSDSVLSLNLPWKKGDSHVIKIQSKTEDFLGNRLNTSISTYQVQLNIINSKESGYDVIWSYQKADLYPSETNIENIILSNLVGIRFELFLSLKGEVIEFQNATEVRNWCNQKLDSLIKLNSKKTVSFKLAKQMLATDKGINIALLKHINFYTLFFGTEYISNKTTQNSTIFPNIFADQSCAAIEKTTLKRIDYNSNMCYLEKSIIVDAVELKNSLLQYLQNSSTKVTAEAINQLKSKSLEYSETFFQEINFKRGIVTKSKFTRRMDLGISNRTINIEMETIN